MHPFIIYIRIIINYINIHVLINNSTALHLKNKIKNVWV